MPPRTSAAATVSRAPRALNRKLTRGQKSKGSHPKDTTRTSAAGLERARGLKFLHPGATQTPEGHA